MKVQPSSSCPKQGHPFLFNAISFLIVVYPLLFIRQGLDFTDMGFWLTNYNLIFTHPDQVAQGFSCYFSEIIGGVWLFLFGWAGVIGMKLGYVLVLYLTVFCVYQVLKDFFNKTHVALMLLVALVFITKSFGNWIDYNNLTALFYALSALFLYRSIKNRSRTSCFLSGFVIATCVFVRIPNILSLFLLLLPLYDDLRKKNINRGSLSDYGFCGLGFLSGLAGVSGLMLLCGHLKIFTNSLIRLLSLAGSSESSHSSGHLFELFINDHIATFKIGGVILFIYLIIIIISLLFVFVKCNSFKTMIGIAVGVSCYCFMPTLAPMLGNRLFFRVFEFTGVLYILLFIIFLWRLFRYDRPNEEFLILLSMLVLLMVPLGSGNGIRNSVFGMWYAIPVAGCFLFQVDRLRIANVAAVAIVLIYSVTTAWEYTYLDNPDRMKMICNVEHPKLKGVLTTENRAEAVQELLDVIPGYVKKMDFLLAVENIPLLYYLTDTLPYLSNSWPFCFSNTDDAFKTALEKAEKRTVVPPMIVRAKGNTKDVHWPSEKNACFGEPSGLRLKNRREMLNDFVKKHHYKKVWESGFFEIWKPGANAAAENDKFYKYMYDFSDYQKICGEFSGKEFHVSFGGLKAETVIKKGLRPLPYLVLQGIRGNFNTAVVRDGDANVLRVKLGPPDGLNSRKISQKKVVQFGLIREKKGFDFDTDSPEFCGLFVKARLRRSGKFQVFIQEKKDGSWHRIKTENIHLDDQWHDYVVLKKIPANISGMTCGITWRPESRDSVLDISSIRCFISGSP